MHEAKQIFLLFWYFLLMLLGAFYFLILSQTENPRNAYFYTLKAFFFLSILFFFLSLSDLGLDQFIVKRYDGKVSTLDY